MVVCTFDPRAALRLGHSVDVIVDKADRAWISQLVAACWSGSDSARAEWPSWERRRQPLGHLTFAC